MEWVGIFVLMVALALSNIGGIGGGGIIIPIAIAMFGMSTREAIALSNSLSFLDLLHATYSSVLMKTTNIDHSLTNLCVFVIQIKNSLC